MSAADEVLRPIVACRVVNTVLGFGRVVYALLDSGSDRDVISQSLITDLKLDTWTEFMTVKTLDSSVEGERRLTSMRLESVQGAYSADIDGALVGAMLTGNNDIPPAKRNLSEFPHLASLRYEDHDAELEMIIGVSHIDTWVSKQVSRGAPNQPLGINTLFGWTVVG